MKQSQLTKFQDWLRENGCEILATTNPYELCRWKGNEHTGVIYTGKRGITFSSFYAEAAYHCFKAKSPWSDSAAAPNARPHKADALIARDGPECFYCGDQFSSQALTQEHMLAKAQGGNNSMANLVLACVPCNSKAGHLPIVQKVALRDEFRGYVA